MLPVSLVDLHIFTDPGVKLGRLLVELLTASTLLGVVVFLNTIVGSETVSQVDDKPPATLAQSLQMSMGQIIGSCMGSLPLSASPTSTLPAERTGGLGRAGLLIWLPQAAMIGLLIFQAYGRVDQSSVTDMWRWT